MRIFILATSILLAAGCARDQAEQPAADDPVRPAASGAETFFRYGIPDLEITRDGLRAKLGEPDSTTRKPVQNLHNSAVTDTLINIYYPGLVAEVYRASYNGRELTSYIRVTDNRYIAEDAPVRIDMPASELPAVMGDPSETDGDTFKYACDTCTELGNERVEVTVGSGRVVAVTVFHSID